MKFSRTALLAGAFLCLGGGAAVAQPGAGGLGGDETRADATGRADQLFGRLDANGDGRLTGDEVRDAMRARGPGRPGGPPPGMGSDGPGGPAAMFDRLDADHNGSLSREEFAHMGPPPGGSGAPGMGRGGAGAGEAMARMIGPNGLTRDEFRTRMLQRFDRTDLNHDGRVTPKERQQARAGMTEMRSAGPMGRPDPDGEQ